MFDFICGLSALIGVGLAIYYYYRGIHLNWALIEKGRSSINNFGQVKNTLGLIIREASAETGDADHKVKQMRLLAETLLQNIGGYINTIDDGTSWTDRTTREVYESLSGGPSILSQYLRRVRSQLER